MKIGDKVMYMNEDSYIPKGTKGEITAIGSEAADVMFYGFKNGVTDFVDVNRTITCQKDELMVCRPFDKQVEKEFEDKKKEANASPTGSLRYNSGKPEFSHINPEFILELASLMTESAKKYSKYNYCKGQHLTTPADSLMRHYLAFMSGEDTDQESKQSHLVHIAANAMIMWCSIKYAMKDHPELDDRFKKVLGFDND